MSLKDVSGGQVLARVKDTQALPYNIGSEAGLAGALAPAGVPFAYDTLAMTANVAYLVRFSLAQALRVNAFSFNVTTGTATSGGENFDFGVYTQTATATWTKVVSTGAIQVAVSESGQEGAYTADLSQFGDSELASDKVYWAAIACAGTPTVSSAIIPAAASSIAFGPDARPANFLLSKTSSYPLPATIASPSVAGEAPLIGVCQG